MRDDSGGAGRFRGGLGHYRDFRIIDHETRITGTFERSACPPWGLAGGKAAATNVLVVNPGREDERSWQKTAALPLRPGDTVSIRTGGGGGYGPPTERDPAAVQADVRNGYVSRDAAAREYGVILTDSLEVDESATEELRNAMT
jgi:N-methylhydantoinase B